MFDYFKYLTWKYLSRNQKNDRSKISCQKKKVEEMCLQNLLWTLTTQLQLLLFTFYDDDDENMRTMTVAVKYVCIKELREKLLWTSIDLS